MKKRILVALASAGMLLCGIAAAQEGDRRILAARDAIRNGERATLERLAAIHDGHVLDPYVRYWYLSSRLARSGEAPPVAELNAFLARVNAEAKGWTVVLAQNVDPAASEAELRATLEEVRASPAWSSQIDARTRLGDAALLELALYRFALDRVTGHGFVPVLPPVLVREEAMYGTGFLPTEEVNIYRVERDDLYLTGTS